MVFQLGSRRYERGTMIIAIITVRAAPHKTLGRIRL